MSPYPPRFNLRHFMSHLAPGGHFFLQIGFPVLFLFWLFFPEDIHALIAMLVRLPPAQLTIAFVIWATICYFVGVVLRLLPVDSIDEGSAEDLLQGALAGKGYFRNRIQYLTACWRAAFVPWWPKTLGVGQVQQLLARRPPPASSHGVEVLLGKATDKDKDMPFRDWLLRGFQADLEWMWAKLDREALPGAAANAPSGSFEQEPTVRAEIVQTGRLIWRKASRTVFETAPAPDFELRAAWLWIADRFPYPRFISYRACSQCRQYRRQFSEVLVPDFKEVTVGREVAPPPRQDLFNRCKSCVAVYCPAAFNEVSERESLVRMMAGFYQGLTWGLRFTAPVVLVASAILITNWLLSPTWVPAKLSHGLPHFLAIGLLVFSVNTWFWMLVHTRFRYLRLSEAQAVFDSYLLANDYSNRAAKDIREAEGAGTRLDSD